WCGAQVLRRSQAFCSFCSPCSTERMHMVLKRRHLPTVRIVCKAATQAPQTCSSSKCPHILAVNLLKPFQLPLLVTLVSF
ncbi:hypothetical protein M514_13930, partial [Trichuris suis]